MPPTTGTTKNPTIPATPPIIKVRRGAPDSAGRRGGSTGFRAWFTSNRAVAPISTPQAVGVMSVSAHHSTAAQTIA
ncbi:hypothetical protein ACN24L_33525 [Streptomyces microflavus]